jgi:hypothetical protein
MPKGLDFLNPQNLLNADEERFIQLPDLDRVWGDNYISEAFTGAAKNRKKRERPWKI